MRVALIVLFLLGSLSTQTVYAKKKNKKTTQDTLAVKKKEPEGMADYKKAIKDATTAKGLFTTHLNKDNKLYFELADSVFSRYYILANRIAETSNTHEDRKSTRLNSSHANISYAVFCLKKKRPHTP